MRMLYLLLFLSALLLEIRSRRGRDCMVVGLATTYGCMVVELATTYAISAYHY